MITERTEENLTTINQILQHSNILHKKPKSAFLFQEIKRTASPLHKPLAFCLYIAETTVGMDASRRLNPIAFHFQVD